MCKPASETKPLPPLPDEHPLLEIPADDWESVEALTDETERVAARLKAKGRE